MGTSSDKVATRLIEMICNFNDGNRLTAEEVLTSFRTAMKDIASGEAIKNARPVEELFRELEND